MTVPYRDAFSQPEFDALIIQFRSEVNGNLANHAARLLETAVQHIFGTAENSWQINPVPGLSRYFDCIPPPEQPVSVKQGFDLKNRLKEEPTLRYVEALFETNLDNLPEEKFVEPDDEGLESLASPRGDLTGAERNPWWNHDMVSTRSAWDHSRGQGIVIGHPDTGYIPHIELDDDRIRHDLEHNFYDNTPGANNSHERGGNHGLGTATVLMSGPGQQSNTHFVTGIAPEAILVPLRISKAGAPIFFTRSGPRRVRNAVRYAIDVGCHVISMSLGGPFEKSLHETIQEAVRKNIIVCAAAGNVVRIVVWPARYKEVIAVAACTAERKKWFHSSRGSTVDVTAPGHNVWRAYIDNFGNPDSAPGSGTSYAVPHVAGIAALWLAKHGRENLLARYQRVPLYLVFRELLKASCDAPPENDRGQFGAGIVNAQQTVTAELPDEDELLARFVEAEMVESLPEAAPTETDYFSTIFDTLPKEEIHQRLAALLRVPDTNLTAHLKSVNQEELAFHLITNPELREYLTDLEIIEEAQADTEGLEGVATMPGSTVRGRALHEKLMNTTLSDELRHQLSAVSD